MAPRSSSKVNPTRQPVGLNVRFVILIFIVFSLTGCASLADPESAQVHTTEILGILGNQPDQLKEMGQSFISRRSGLNGLTFWLSASPLSTPPNPVFSIEVYRAEDLSIPFYKADYQLPSSGYQGSFRINFPPRTDDPPGQSYLFVLTAGEGSIQVHGRADEIYPYGTALLNGNETEADLAFSTTYSYGIVAFIQDLLRAARSIGLVLPLGFTLLIPGWLLLDLLGIRIRGYGLYILTLASGLSLAILPVILLWTSRLGLSWSGRAVNLTFAGLALLAVWRLFMKIRQTHGFRLATRIPLSDFALILVILFSCLVRIIMVRDYTFPPWVDSVHHGVLARLIQTNGSFPDGYAPYFEMDPTDYHLGFHAGLAVFQWLSKLPLPSAILIYGQALNLVGVLSAGLFARKITRSRWAAVWASLAAGVLMPLPAYLTSWGRYTHLAGLIIFVSCLILTEGLFSKKIQHIYRYRYLNLLAAGIALSGLFLVHYRVAFFLLCWWLINEIVSWSSHRLFIRIQMLAAICLVGILLSLPWLISAVQNTFIIQTPQPGANLRPLFADFDPSLLTAASGRLVLVAALIGWLVLLFNHPRKGISMAGWVGLLFLAANLAALGLPGGNFVNNISVEITLYLPLSVLFGYALFWVGKAISQRIPLYILPPFRILGIVSLVVLLVVGSNSILPILNPATVLAHSSDISAIRWVAENIPGEAAFLVNAFDWGYGICAGSDGGYWISPLAGNPTYPPPVLYGQGSAQEINRIVQICQQTTSQASDPFSLWQYMKTIGVRYIYIGSRGGPLSPDKLAGSENFILLYHQPGAWIFKSIP